MSADPAAIVDQVIQARRTLKVMSATPFEVPPQSSEYEELIAAAGNAPFHRPANSVHLEGRTLSSLMPWRFYVLDAAACRVFREQLQGQDCGRIPDMLATADIMIQATWLPDPPKESLPEKTLFAATLENMEHLAAAGAAIQSLLIAATARGIPNYWSSGGILRTPAIFQKFQIPEREILLGSLFLFPRETGSAEVLTTKLHDKRGLPQEWIQWIRAEDLNS